MAYYKAVSKFEQESNLISKVLITDQKDLFKLIPNSFPKYLKISILGKLKQLPQNHFPSFLFPKILGNFKRY